MACFLPKRKTASGTEDVKFPISAVEGLKENALLYYFLSNVTASTTIKTIRNQLIAVSGVTDTYSVPFLIRVSYYPNDTFLVRFGEPFAGGTLMDVRWLNIATLQSASVTISPNTTLSDFISTYTPTLNTESNNVIGAINELDNKKLETNDAGNLIIGSSKVQANGYIIGTWLQSTANNALSTKPPRICVQDNSGWIYSRTPAQLLGDIGAVSATASNLKTEDKTVIGAINEINDKVNAVGIVTIDKISNFSIETPEMCEEAIGFPAQAYIENDGISYNTMAEITVDNNDSETSYPFAMSTHTPLTAGNNITFARNDEGTAIVINSSPAMPLIRVANANSSNFNMIVSETDPLTFSVEILDGKLQVGDKLQICTRQLFTYKKKLKRKYKLREVWSGFQPIKETIFAKKSLQVIALGTFFPFLVEHHMNESGAPSSQGIRAKIFF